MITLTAGGVTITVTKEDAAFYMRLGYSPSTGSGTGLSQPPPLPASPFVPDGKNGEEPPVPTAPTGELREKGNESESVLPLKGSVKRKK